MESGSPAPVTPPASVVSAAGRRGDSSARPYGGYFDGWSTRWRGCADFDAAVERVVVDRGELTLHDRQRGSPRSARSCAMTPRCASSCAPRCPVWTTRRSRRAAAARCLPADLDDLPASDPAGVRGARRRPASADGHSRSIRPRTGRSGRRTTCSGHLRRSPEPDPDPDAGRLGGPPPAQGLSAGRCPGGVQGRGDPPPDQRRSYQ